MSDESVPGTLDDIEAAFSDAAAKVRADLAADDAWDTLEDLAASSQRPDEVSNLYRDVLRSADGKPEASALAQRAVNFHEEWYSEDSPALVDVLQLALARDPEADWALQRLTVVFTVGERWADMLALYDQCIAAATDDGRRQSLLEEAAQTAKDFAGAPERAIDYLTQLYDLRSDDRGLAANLERLLEKHEKWSELVALWRRRAETEDDVRVELSLRVAEVELDKLRDGASCLAGVRALLDSEISEETTNQALQLLERLARDEGIDAEPRREAIVLLRARYDAADRTTDVMATLDAALALADVPERVSLHRDAAKRLAEAGDLETAMGHLGSVLRVAPGDEEARVSLRELAARAGAEGKLVELLLGAADAAPPGPEQSSLLYEAAERAAVAGDAEGALQTLSRIAAGASEDQALSVVRLKCTILEPQGPSEALLDALVELANLVEENDRREVLGRGATLAHQLGDIDRALALWEFALAADPRDDEALEATVAITKQAERWTELVPALRRRIDATTSAWARRNDLMEIARVQDQQLALPNDAVATWNELAATYGEDSEAVDALLALYQKTERWDDLVQLLERASSREEDHLAKLRALQGQAYGQQLGQPVRAMRALARALGAKPDLAEGREGLQLLMDDAEVGAEAVEALAQAHLALEEWDQVLGLLPKRLETSPETGRKVELLREAARIHEEGGAPLAAMRAVATALELTPRDVTLETDLLRLAGAAASTGSLDDEGGDPGETAWSETALTFGNAAEATDDPLRKADLYRQEADVYRDRLGDLGKAFDANVKVLGVDPRDAVRAELLVGLAETTERDEEAMAALDAAVRAGAPIDVTRALAVVQRRTGVVGILESLGAMAEVDGADLDALAEACERALAFEAAEQLGAERVTDLLSRLYSRAAAMWRRGLAATGERTPDAMARWSLETLLSRHDAAGDERASQDLLEDGALLPVDPAEVLRFQRLAAERAMGLGDTRSAAEGFRKVLRADPNDREALDRLAGILEKEERHAELLDVRRQELALAEEPTERLRLRMAIADLVTTIEETGGRTEALMANLEEHPGHGPSLEALERVLVARRRYGDLAKLLGAQAGKVEDAATAAGLWRHAAETHERDLGDAEAAADAYRRAAEHEGAEPNTLSALARLARDRGDSVEASRWLERRVAVATDEERPGLSLELSRALLDSGRTGRAREVLEAAHGVSPGHVEIRELLLERYRAEEDLEALTGLLARAATDEADTERALAFVHEAATLYREHMRDVPVEQALGVLRRGVELAPDDQELALQLADTLRQAGELEEARERLDAAVAAFGRRRSPERAQVHYALGLVARAQGQMSEAIEQLELASKMAMADPKVLSLLGRLAREADDLDRAEKAYRALLMTVRRQSPGEGADVGQAEVMAELGFIAGKRGDEEKGRELLDSAYELAAQNDMEAIRLRDALHDRGENALAVDAMARRVAATEDKASKAAMLAALAEAMDWAERGSEGLDKRLEALELDPESQEIHTAALAASQRLEQTLRYAEKLEALAEKFRRADDAAVQGGLLLRRGELAEAEGEFEAARGFVARAEELLASPTPAWRALARIGKAADDKALQERVLASLVEAPDVGADERTEVIHALARVQLSQPTRLAEGLASARRAYDADPRADVLAASLDAAVASAGEALEGEDGDALFAFYERVTRDAANPQLLLNFLERRAFRSGAQLGQVKEAADHAVSQEAYERAEALFERALGVAEHRGLGDHEVQWALEGLVAARRDGGNVQGALDPAWRLVELADDPDERRRLTLELGALASGEGGDLSMAAQVYQSLREEEPTDEAAWRPLLEVYTAAQDEDALFTLVNELVDDLLDPALRNVARMAQARFLIGDDERAFDAVDVLKSVLDEEPDHAEGTQLLSTLYEKSGYSDDLAELLERQLDVARDNEDLAQISELSLKLGTLLEKVRREDAMDVYRRALDWVTDNRGIIENYLGLMDEDTDPYERMEVREKLLALEEGAAASALANELAAFWMEKDDPTAAARVIRVGIDGNPEDLDLRQRLETAYREGENWEGLAEFLAAESGRVGDPTRQVELLQEAAQLRREQLGDPSAAAALLEDAYTASGDTGLLKELVAARRELGEHDQATEAVTRALEAYAEGRPEDDGFARLLAMRASLRGDQDDLLGALEDLERAYALLAEETVGPLVQMLHQLRNVDAEHRRAATMRLVDVLAAHGDAMGSRDLLADWTEEVEDDVESLQKLRDIDVASENWLGVSVTSDKLVRALAGEAQVDAAMLLADASVAAGEPERARDGLEFVVYEQPQSERALERLKGLYESLGAFRELADVLAREAQQFEESDPEAAFGRYSEAGEVLLHQVGDAEGALPMLARAVEMKPDAHEVVVVLADAYIGSSRFAEAGELLERAIANHPRRRSPELSQLQHRMARLAQAAGDRGLEQQWLAAALESDKNNAHAASELATLAYEHGDHETALTALRAVTLGKNDGPMSKAQAFLMQARIANQRGEARRALLWARKAKSEDPDLEEANEFLAELGEA